MISDQVEEGSYIVDPLSLNLLSIYIPARNPLLIPVRTGSSIPFRITAALKDRNMAGISVYSGIWIWVSLFVIERGKRWIVYVTLLAFMIKC